jgi:hypothetical protein
MRRIATITPAWTLVLIVIPFLVLQVPASATAGSMPKGTVELSTAALFNHFSYHNRSGDKGSSLLIDATFGEGLCLTDAVETKFGLEVSHGESSSSFSASEGTAWGGSAMLVYNFKDEGPTIPYFEGGVGGRFYGGDAYENADVSTLLPILGVGVRCLIRKAVSLNVELTYQRIVNAGGVKDLTASGILLGVGFSVLLEPKPEGRERPGP